MGKISIKKSDITTEDVDCIVNAANTSLLGGGGVDGAIHRAAGISVLEECRKIGYCATGDAVITNAGNLKAKKIIHAVGPVWSGGKRKEPELLKNCYVKSLELAKKYGLQSIAFPAISTGVYRYPVEDAAKIALKAGIDFNDDFDEIRYVCFSKNTIDIYKTTYNKLTKRN